METTMMDNNKDNQDNFDNFYFPKSVLPSFVR